MAVNEWSFFCTPYDRKQVERFAPKEPGIYLIWIRNGAGRWECFYVGKADNLEARLLDHLADSEPNACIRELRKFTCGLYWMEIAAAADRDGAEKYLYDVLNPACNVRDPGGTALRIPLPPSPADY